MKIFMKFMQERNIWKKRISAALACIVVFVTVYAMVLPAITLDWDAADQDDGFGFENEDWGADDSFGDSASEDETVWPLTLTWPDSLTEGAEASAAEENGPAEEEIPDYTVTAVVYEDSGIPEDAVLTSSEIKKGEKNYDDYYKSALDKVRMEAGEGISVSSARFFDIAFVTEDVEVEPDHLVTITIDCPDETESWEEENLYVIHFDPEDMEEPGLMGIESMERDGQVLSVTFSSDAFSVYGLVRTGNTETAGEYLELQHSLLGGDSILLSELLETSLPDQENLQIGSVTEVTAGTGGGEASAAALPDEGNVLEVSPGEGDGDYRIEAPASREEDLAGQKSALEVSFEDGSRAEFEITISGTPEVDAGLAVISSADGIYLPEDAEGRAEEVAGEDLSPAAAEAADAGGSDTVSRVFDISLNLSQEGLEAYEGGFLVDLTLPEEVTGRDFHLYHIHDGVKDELAIEKTGIVLDSSGLESVSGIQFVTESFSEFVLQYTVDFEYSVNGEVYQFSLPGGGFVSFTDLVEVLGIIGDTNSDKNRDEIKENADDNIAKEGAEESGINSDTNAPLALGDNGGSDATRKFVENIENVEFSNPELVDVSKVDSDTTVGQIKDSYGLECQYNAELTEEQIAEINAQTVKTGDWALISLQPFTSEETLTVSMKDGEVFTIRVTDYQISTNVLTADGQTYKITVTYDDDAEIPEGTKLIASEIEPGTDEYIQLLGQAWTEENKEYFEVEEKRENYDESMGELPDVPYTNINTARFFDISLICNDEEIEPKAPVQVEISYVQGLEAWEETTPGVAQYVSGAQVEIIEDVKTTIQNEEVKSFRYEQESFSTIGTYVAQELPDTYAEPKLAPAPDPNGTAEPRNVELDSKTLDSIVRASLSTAGLLRAEETESPDTEDPTTQFDKPEAHKSLTPNKEEGVNDGTYTLTLSVKGHSNISAEKYDKKANVLLVMDRSSSMITKTVNDESLTWYYGTKETSSWRGDIKEPNYHFTGMIDGQSVDLNVDYGWNNTNWSNPTITYVSGKDNWGRDIYSAYPDDAPIFVTSKKTRMRAEQEALSTLFGQLMGLNDATGDNKDIVEVSVISFGDERFDKKSWSDETEVDWQSGRNTTALMNGALSNRFTSGTNWEEALQYAYAVISAKKEAEETAGKNEDYYVIFLTDGEPTNSVAHSGGNTAWAGNDNQRRQCYDAAKDEAQDLAEICEFYNVFTFRKGEDEKYSVYLTNYAYGNGDYNGNKNTDAVKQYYEDAQTIQALNDKFNDIFFKVADALGHGNVSITDTLTTDAMTTTVVQGKTNGYVYEVKDSSGTVLYTVTSTGDLSNPTVVFNVPGSNQEEYTATPHSVGDKTVYTVRTNEGKLYKMALADIDDETGELVWDLSPVGILMDDCTYSVKFVVWPDQDAYDYVAALNNGLKEITDSQGKEVPVEWNQDSVTQVGNYFKGGSDKYPSIVYYPGTGDDYEKGIYNGTFAVLTNTDQKLHYSVVETKTVGTETETNITGPFYHDLETPDPMPLTASSSVLEKLWNVERDPGILAQYLYDHKGKPTEFQITFDILQDKNGQAEAAPAEGGEGEAGTSQNEDETSTGVYTTVTIGWDPEANNGNGAYIWDPGTERTVKYNNNDCVVGTRWAADFSIATGLMLSGDRMDAIRLDRSAYPSGIYNGKRYYLLEEGHDYTISEPGLAFEFDFSAPTYHPMLVDGVLKNVNFTVDETQELNENKVSFEKMSALDLDEGIPSLKIENTLRGYINLDKVVVGTDGTTLVSDDHSKFEYTVILQNSTDPGPFTAEGSHIPWYGIDELYYHTVETTEDGEEIYHYYQAQPQGEGQVKLTDEDGTEYNVSCVGTFQQIVGPQTLTFEDGTTIQLLGNEMDWTSDNYVSAKLQISQHQTLNIANIPVGTQYSITEGVIDGYELVKIDREIRIDPETAPESSDTVTGTSSIEGTIVANRDNHIIYTNKKQTTSIGIEKIWNTPDGMSGGTADVVLYSIVGKKAEELEEGEIDPAKPSDKIFITIDASLVSEQTGESVGVSRDAYIEIAYTGTSTGGYRLNNENGWSHTFEFERGGTYSFTYTADGTKVKTVTPVESKDITSTKTIPLTATVEHIAQYVYTFTVPVNERQDKGGIVVTCNGEEKTADTENNNWTVEFSIANGATVAYSASPANGFIDTVTLEPESAAGEVASSNKTVKMHPGYAETALFVPVTVHWPQTPPNGTTVTVNFTPDKEGVTAESLTLNGTEGEAWTTEQTLPRLDGNGELITWTVTTTAASPEGYNVLVSLSSPSGATISDTANDVVVNGTVALTTMEVPIRVNWGAAVPDEGTVVTVTFTNGTDTETVTLDGSESTPWITTKVLPRLDSAGNDQVWAVSTSVTPEGGSASVTGAPASVSDPDGDGIAHAVDLTGSVNRTMNLTVKTIGGDNLNVNIGGIYKATLTGGTVYYNTSDSAGSLSGYGVPTRTLEGLDVKAEDGTDQYYAILLWEGNVDTRTDLTTAGYTIFAREDYFTTRTVVYFKAETGDKTIELTKNNTTAGRVVTGQTMNSVGPGNSANSTAGRYLRRTKGATAPLKAANTGSPTQTFHDPALTTGTPAFTAIQYKDLPEGATPVETDGDGNPGTQTITGNASYTWSNLPNQTEDGHPIYYYVVEKQATAQADTMSVDYRYTYNADGTIKEVIITNTTTGTPTPTKGDITVTKSFVGLEEGVDLPANFKITNSYDDQVFTVSNASGTNPYTWTLSGVDGGTTVTFTESGATVNGYNLTVTSNATVVEDAMVSATVIAGETVTAPFVNTYEQKTVDVTLKKVDKENINKTPLEASDLLDEAKFILEKYTQLSPVESKDVVWNEAHNELNVGTGGIFTFTDLPVGIYKIVEKEYPNGYVHVTTDPIFEVVVDEDTGELRVQIINDSNGLVRLDDKNELIIIVGNEPGVALPNTGGPGTRLFTILGSILILGAGVLLWRRRRTI